MNYILNNKLKFEKNRYNKPVISPTPVILSRTLKTPPLPIPLKIDLPQYSYPHIPEYLIDFKLNNHSTHLKQIIKQINDPQPKPHFDQVNSESIIYPYYNNELVINIYGFSTHLHTKIFY